MEFVHQKIFKQTRDIVNFSECVPLNDYCRFFQRVMDICQSYKNTNLASAIMNHHKPTKKFEKKEKYPEFTVLQKEFTETIKKEEIIYYYNPKLTSNFFNFELFFF